MTDIAFPLLLNSFLSSDNDAKPLGPNVWCETDEIGISTDEGTCLGSGYSTPLLCIQMNLAIPKDFFSMSSIYGR